MNHLYRFRVHEPDSGCGYKTDEVRFVAAPDMRTALSIMLDDLCGCPDVNEHEFNRLQSGISYTLMTRRADYEIFDATDLGKTTFERGTVRAGEAVRACLSRIRTIGELLAFSPEFAQVPLTPEQVRAIVKRSGGRVSH